MSHAVVSQSQGQNNNVAYSHVSACNWHFLSVCYQILLTSLKKKKEKSSEKPQVALIHAVVAAVEEHGGFIAIHFQNGSGC